VREEVVEDLAADGAALAAGAAMERGAKSAFRSNMEPGLAAGNAPATHGDQLGLTPDPGAVAVSSSMRPSIYGGHHQATISTSSPRPTG
jgi:hypothetical protein